LQNKRWNEILGKMILEGEKKGLTEEFVQCSKQSIKRV
jgi:chorismate mutase